MVEKYWLMKSEPDVYSIDDLAKSRVDMWEGVRNYQARNMMRDEMSIGDGVLFYHSNAKPSGVAGLARIAGPAYPDPTAVDPSSKYYDPKSSPDQPRWLAIDVEYVETFAQVIPLSTLRQTAGLSEMMVIKRGMRLSIQPVTAAEWDVVVTLGRTARPAPRPLRGGGAKKVARSRAGQ
ncbi:MAG: EVE domain-containing protein [Myxococcota bacterium]